LSAGASQQKPSIAVLPFINLSGDPEQEYFSDGITEDIITELSRFRQLRVVSRNSSSRFGGRNLDMVRVGRELGVQYLVEGSVRRMGLRTRITAQLIDAVTGDHIWAERYDNAQDEIFDVQDRVVRTIVATLAGRVSLAGAEIALRKPPTSLAAYELVLRADALQWGTLEGAAEARLLLEKAVEIDPGYARAYAHLSFSRNREWRADMSESNRLLDEAFELACKAVALDENDTLCQLAMAWTHLYRGAYKLADQFLARTLALNPNQPSTQAVLAAFHNRGGEPERAIEEFLAVSQIDPYYTPSWYWGELGAAYFNARRYVEAIAAMRRSVALRNWHRAWLAASYALADMPDAARECTAELLRRMPGFSVRQFVAKEPLQRPGDKQHLVDGLRQAGLPD
jgi:TolB-like protein/Tfp pilus assembly protein PilF